MTFFVPKIHFKFMHSAFYFIFFVNWFTDIFTEDLGMEGEINIKIKYIKYT